MTLTTSRFRALRWSLIGAVALLALVYILGMSLNLGFGSFATLMNIHMGLGALTLLAGLAATVLALLERRTGGAVAAGIGALFTIMAFAGGGAFLQTGQDGASLVMALGYLGALLAFGAALVVTHR